MEDCAKCYRGLIDLGATPQEARSVLPNGLKVELIMTANLREWRHILKLRTSPAAHPDMRYITCHLLKEVQLRIPVVFDDISLDERGDGLVGLYASLNKIGGMTPLKQITLEG